MLASLLGLACGPSVTPDSSPAVSPEPGVDAEPGESAEIAVLEPSPFLELLRLERQAAEGPLAVEGRDVEEADAAAETPDEGNPLLDDLVKSGVIEEDVEEDDEFRTVIVRTSPFATYEDVFRYGLRAMDKTQRSFNPTRALARLEGPVRVRDAGGAEPSAVRSYVRRLIRARRPAIKACIAQELRNDPRVLLDEPSGLVFEQALRFGDGAYRFLLDIQLEDGTPAIEVTDRPETPVDDSTRECLGAALADASLTAPVTEGLADVRAPLVVFVQAAVHADEPSMAEGLAMQAATLGWQHYERGEFLEAREWFLDAAWAYHIPEYQALVGRAEEALGRPKHAIAAYRRYVDERPDAPDAAALAARIEALRSASEG